MIFNLFARKTCCEDCGDGFEDLSPVPLGNSVEIKHHLLEAKFECPSCGAKFHGKCGHVGGASPSGATVKCASCQRSFHQQLPFVIVR